MDSLLREIHDGDAVIPVRENRNDGMTFRVFELGGMTRNVVFTARGLIFDAMGKDQRAFKQYMIDERMLPSVISDANGDELDVYPHNHHYWFPPRSSTRFSARPPLPMDNAPISNKKSISMLL